MNNLPKIVTGKRNVLDRSTGDLLSCKSCNGLTIKPYTIRPQDGLHDNLMILICMFGFLTKNTDLLVTLLALLLRFVVCTFRTNEQIRLCLRCLGLFCMAGSKVVRLCDHRLVLSGL